MSNLKNNRSLFIYTALIFVVAIIMILLAFFGQSNLDKNQPLHSDANELSITEKAAKLSEDNRILLQENMILKDQIVELTKERQSLIDITDNQATETANSNLLLKAYSYIYNGWKTKARELLKNINQEELTENQLAFYKILVKKSK